MPRRGAVRMIVENPGRNKVIPAIGKMEAKNPRPAERSTTLSVGWFLQLRQGAVATMNPSV